MDTRDALHHMQHMSKGILHYKRVPFFNLQDYLQYANTSKDHHLLHVIADTKATMREYGPDFDHPKFGYVDFKGLPPAHPRMYFRCVPRKRTMWARLKSAVARVPTLANLLK